MYVLYLFSNILVNDFHWNISSSASLCFDAAFLYTYFNKYFYTHLTHTCLIYIFIFTWLYIYSSITRFSVYHLGRDKRPVKSLVVGRPILLALEDIDGGPSFLEKALCFLEKYGKCWYQNPVGFFCFFQLLLICGVFSPFMLFSPVALWSSFIYIYITIPLLFPFSSYIAEKHSLHMTP